MHKLGIRILRAVVDKNSFDYAQQWEHDQLSTDRLYIQLVNLDYNTAGSPPGIRYIPEDGATVKITLPSIDASKVVSGFANAPFADDASIWLLDVDAAADFGSGNLVVVLTEGLVSRKITLLSGIRVLPVDAGMCL